MVLTAASPTLQFRLTPFEPIKARSRTILQRWGMKGPIRACWKYSACSPYLAWPIIPSAALLTSPSPLGCSAPLCAVIDMWITMCGDSNKSASRAGYPAGSQSQLALPERQPLPPSEEANKNDKLTVKELHIFHMLSWKLLRFCQGFFFFPLFSPTFLPISHSDHIQIYETPHLSRQSKNNSPPLWRGPLIKHFCVENGCVRWGKNS